MFCKPCSGDLCEIHNFLFMQGLPLLIEQIQQFEQNLQQNLAEIQRLLKEKRYEPSPVLRVMIPKDNGKMRKLGIPTVRDRVVQQALKNVLEPIFEEIFLPQSHGYRPNTNA